MSSQNLYDDQKFFDGYAQLPRSQRGLDGAPEWKSIEAMLPQDFTGYNVLDLGAGYGWFSRYAVGRGATHVDALDISSKMIEKAKELTAAECLPSISYKVQDLEHFKATDYPTSYDLVYCSLTLHYIVGLKELLENVYQCLKPGGAFVFTAEHPIFTAAKNPQPWWIENNSSKIWPVSHYSVEGERTTNWITEGIVKQHRKLSTYINLLIQVGFKIDQIDEWGPSAQQIKDNPSLDEEKDRPMMFLMSLHK
ncbi:hypothetical protein CYY_004068 [Polysphondylium violaceum]|uniref:Methyltransferase domain-containing protein n=1 Tax=Polysphondylium violaceum TaxID=133409 RepID=A0A8J4PXJ8_9MYCE|nr:hypothetical protein CYY_004068 [Polysphondylium violaceum]